MPITFTKEEVKEFLEEQGFDVSDERTLKNFIHDLKKLIKYEDMQRRRKKLGHLPDETVLDSTDGRIPYTSTSATQDSSSSPYEDDSKGNDENSRSQFQKSIGKPSGTLKKKSPEKKREIPRSPVRQQRPYTKREPVGETPLTGSYGSDVTTSYEPEDSARKPLVSKIGSKESAQKQQQRPPPTSQRPLTENAMRSQPITSAPPPPKKKGNRLIMKRITASQDVNGDSIIEESDVDLGPLRRPHQYQPAQKQKLPAFARPKTAPSKPDAGARKPSRSEPVSRPMSSRSLNIDKARQQQENEIDTDELFKAISELILPTGRLDSDESIFDEDECKTKQLLKPPPHVARDPVLLYHWYKTYNWDLYTIPGEDRHMKLRWNVRAKTVGGYHPCVEIRKIAKPKNVREMGKVPYPICR